jgi:hypothetical protein
MKMTDWDELRKRERAIAFRRKHKMREPNDPVQDAIRREAYIRETTHDGLITQRKLSKDYDLIGAAGEFSFREWLGSTPIEKSTKRNVNMVVNGKTINVLTARKPTWLIVEKGKVKADFYVLAQYDDATERARLLGWTTKASVLAGYVRDYGGHNILSHGVDRRDLFPMDELKKELGIAPKQPSLFGDES